MVPLCEVSHAGYPQSYPQILWVTGWSAWVVCNITIFDASSDMLVIDITNSATKYNVGDLVTFKIKYMGALYLLNSDYIGKFVE